LNEDIEESWVELRRFSSQNEAQQHALVLVAAGINCQISKIGDSVGLRVAAQDRVYAQSELIAYTRDNRPSSLPTLPQRPAREAIAGTLFYCCVLLLVHGAASRQMFSLDWILAGKAAAGLIVEGEWWRTVTALTLHGDYGHLFSNLVAGAFLGFVLSQILGGGLAWLLILLSGALGNSLNAVIQPAAHTSIGASTAVFGALGILAVIMSRYRATHWKAGLRRWAPLGAGIMLLAFLGIQGERIDVLGHIAGFVAGCLLGAGTVAFGTVAMKQPRKTQFIFAAAALALLIGTWMIALDSGSS
jgi:rhomboid protease GluP